METRSNHVLVGAVVLILLAVLALFTVWLVRWGTASESEFDILFPQSVDGLAKGSAVTYSGVPSGQVKDIEFYRPDPRYVRVRIAVRPDTPVLQGTYATVQGSFTGTSTVSLDGATPRAPVIACDPNRLRQTCPFGVPLIRARAGGFGAILANAPQLLDRLTTLTERLTILLGDRNQASIAGILENTNRLSHALADRGPEIAATLAETRIAIRQAGEASRQIGELANTSNSILNDNVRPATQNLNTTIASAQRSMDNLNGAISDARPGLQAFSRQTIPEVGQLVHDLRNMSAALTNVAERLDQGGAGSLVGQQRLPDYNARGGRR